MISKTVAGCAALAGALIAATSAWAITIQNPPPTSKNPNWPTSPYAPKPPQAFAYVIGLRGTTPSGRPVQQVRMAKLEQAGPPRAFDLKTLQTNVSAAEDIIIGRLFASPNNALVVVESTVVPIDGLDIDYQAYSLSSQAAKGFFNDETAYSMIDRAHCPSPKFDAFLAAEKAFGVPDSLLAQYDFQIDNQNFVAPSQVAWVNDTTLYIRWTFDIYSKTKGFMPTTSETFDLQIKMSSTPVTLVSCHAPASLGTPSAPIHVLTPDGDGPPGTIKLDGTQVLFHPPLSKSPAYARKAVEAAGNIPN
jgi:hypothetical protein